MTNASLSKFDQDISKFDQAVNRIYSEPMLDKFAVCSQWPNECGTTDSIFVDGGFADNPALVINVAQYHLSGGRDLAKKLKVILANTNRASGTDYQYTQALKYFDSPINEGVEPGDFIWPASWAVPLQSPQIFAESMDASTVDSLIEPIQGSNMTTILLKGTTIDNPVFGIKAGQEVEILAVNLNEDIITFIATPGLSELYTEPLADMTVHIAENEELANRIRAFVESDLDEDTASPTDSPLPAGSSTVYGSASNVWASLLTIALLLLW